MNFNTKAVHAGVEPDIGTGALMTPIFQTSTYIQTSPGNHKGYEYSRSQNPTREALESSLVALENAKYGFAFASGMAAIDTVMKLFKQGDEVIACSDLYGGTYRLFTKILTNFGLKFHFADMEKSIESIKENLTTKTKMIWLETPTNPMLNIIDIRGVVDLVAEFNQKNDTQILVAVDNTFATPYLQQPMNLGADLVMHSVTKYLGGHSDVIMGAVVCDDKNLADQIRFLQNAAGAVPGPMDCFLVLRGIKTLHLRMERHSENAKKIAEFLSKHSKVDRVYWPGLVSHRNHEIATKQMTGKGFGGMISFNLKEDTFENALAFLTNVRIFVLAESLGGVESLVNHPASMTHASIPKEIRINNGITDSLIRLSVGIEDSRDLIQDLEKAFKSI